MRVCCHGATAYNKNWSVVRPSLINCCFEVHLSTKFSSIRPKTFKPIAHGQLLNLTLDPNLASERDTIRANKWKLEIQFYIDIYSPLSSHCQVVVKFYRDLYF